MTWNNLKFFEDNNCGDVFFVLNDYLENLILIHNNLKISIKSQREKLDNINNLLNSGIKIPIDELVLCNDTANALLKDYNIVKYNILEVNSIMNTFILDYKKLSLNFFKKVLAFYVEKEEYSNCKTLQNVIDLLS